MGWLEIASLIVQIGAPAAVKIIDNWLTAAPVTPEKWDEVKTMASQTAKDRMLKVMADQKIDPASDAGKALLALVG